MIGKSDRLSLMETFLRIVEAGSLSAAGTQLGTSQPTISRRLRTLESSLGVRLLQRNTHGMQLTDAGQRYVARAKELLADWQGFEADLRGDDDVPEGILRVVAPHAFGQDRLVKPVTEYLRRYPKTTVEWRLHDGPLRLVEDGIDCVIRVGALDGESVVARKIFDVERIIVAAPSVVGQRAITRPAQLEVLPWLAFGTFYRNSVRLQNERGTARVIRFRPRFITDSLFALRTAALEGMGLAVVSTWVVEDDLARGRLVHVLPGWRAQSIPVYVAYPEARFYPAKLRRFVEVMRTAFTGP
jgi:DNA-binding transcriptional LysR family regulator